MILIEFSPEDEAWNCEGQLFPRSNDVVLYEAEGVDPIDWTEKD